MDIVDSQIHFGPGGTVEVLAEMDALGIQACLVDEFWGLETWGPAHVQNSQMVHMCNIWRRSIPSWVSGRAQIIRRRINHFKQTMSAGVR